MPICVILKTIYGFQSSLKSAGNVYKICLNLYTFSSYILIPHFILQKIRKKSSIYKNSNTMIKEIFCGFMELYSIGGWAGCWRFDIGKIRIDQNTIISLSTTLHKSIIVWEFCCPTDIIHLRILSEINLSWLYNIACLQDFHCVHSQ